LDCPNPGEAQTEGQQTPLPSWMSDSTELNQHFAACMPQLHQTAARLLRNPEDSEDALQDAMLSAFRNLRKFQGRAQFSTWVHHILLNAAWSILRKQKVRAMTYSIDCDLHDDDPRLEKSLADERPNPEEEYGREEGRRLVTELLKALPADYRAVIWHCEMEGLKVREAAKKLGKPVGTLKSQRHRARQMILRDIRRRFDVQDGDCHQWRRKSPLQPLDPDSGRRAHETLRLKLQPEPVPEPLWGFSAYRMLRRRASWQQIRRDTLVTPGHRCSACGSRWQPLGCHAKWRYHVGSTTATLESFSILCITCTVATYIDRSVQHGQTEIAIKQLSRVNGITLADAKRLFGHAMSVWKERNQKDWKVAVAKPLLERYPQLTAVISAKDRSAGIIPMRSPSVRFQREAMLRIRVPVFAER
jgi:RNA polymerase sigma factor (sigma-70 family)